MALDLIQLKAEVTNTAIHYIFSEVRPNDFIGTETNLTLL